MSTSSTVPSEIVWGGIYMWMAHNLISMRMNELLDSLRDDFFQDQERVSANHMRGMLMGARVDVTVQARKPEQRNVFGRVISAASNWQTTIKIQHSKFRCTVAIRSPSGTLSFTDPRRKVQCYASSANMADFKRWISRAKLSGHAWFAHLDDHGIEAAKYRSQHRA